MPKNPAPKGQTGQSRAVQRRQLAEAAELAHRAGGVPIPWDLDAHRAGCSLCRELSAGELADLESQYLAWVPLRSLADQYHEPAGLTVGSARELIRRHAAAHLWDLRRLGDLGTAYSRIIDAGLSHADDTATVRDALDALRELAGARRADRAFLAGEPDPGDELPHAIPAGGALVTYEARIRAIRASSTTPAEPATVQALDPHEPDRSDRGDTPPGPDPGEVDRSTLSPATSPSPTQSDDTGPPAGTPDGTRGAGTPDGTQAAGSPVPSGWGEF